MKKTLITTLLLLTAAMSLRADLIWYEGFNYANGPIISNSAGVWLRHSGTASPSDSIVNNDMLQISATGGTLSRQDDVHRGLVSPYTNSAIQVFASFTVIVTNLPNGAGAYFAHFTDGTSSDFFGRTFALTGTNLCLPNCFRLGIAATAASANKIFPVDLALNTPYQVVIAYDANGADTLAYTAQLWVNPVGSSDTSVVTGDTVSAALQGKIMQWMAFRQASTFGNFFANITNLSVATTFDEAATNVWPNTPVAPTIVTPPVGFSGFEGVSNALTVVANGQSLASLTYTWQKGGVSITNPNGNTNVFSFPNPQISDSGSYDVVIANPNSGLSITSTPVNVSITFAPVPPTITKSPTNTSCYPGQNVTLSVAATGPGPITYQWNYLPSGPISGATDTSYVVTDVMSGNGTLGGYYCDAINTFGTTHSSTGIVSQVFPLVTNIGYLRTLVDPTFYLPTNTTAYYTVTGTVISKTNFTTSANSEFFIQDATGGISVFVGGGATVQPQYGDSVTVTGPLAQFNSLLEFGLSATDPSHIVVTNSSGNVIPALPVLPFYFTNSVQYGGVSNAIRLYEGSLLTFTNVYFATADGVTTFAAGSSYVMTNSSGQGFTLFVYSGFAGMTNTVIPSFCYTVRGVASFFLGNTAPDRSAGYQLEISDPADLVTTPSAPVVLTDTAVGGVNTVSWTAVPYSYSYSVLGAASLGGPYLPVASGIIFTSAAGSYSAPVGAGAKFYQVTSP
jgi:hypothetical protein